jgi:hypothetical protein
MDTVRDMLPTPPTHWSMSARISRIATSVRNADVAWVESPLANGTKNAIVKREIISTAPNLDTKLASIGIRIRGERRWGHSHPDFVTGP